MSHSWECSPQALSLRPSDLDGTTARLHCGSVGQEGRDRGCAGDAVGAVKRQGCFAGCAVPQRAPSVGKINSWNGSASVPRQTYT